MRPAVPLAVAAASLLLVAGCGSTGQGGDRAVDRAQGSDTAEATELTIRLRSGPAEPERTYRLVCDPPGGDHPDPEAACRLLEELENPFEPVPPEMMCTEIYGGPQTAVVTGTFRGEPVDATFDRTDGCQIARWDAHLALLVERGGVGGS